MLPFGLHNAATTIGHLVAQCMILFPVNNEFVGVIEHVTESLQNLITEELGSSSGSDSSKGSHHPSWDCFMTGTPEGHVESISMEEATPVGNLDGETKGETAAPPRVGVEQLRARKREIDEPRLALVREYAEVDREIERRGDNGRARAVAHDVNRKIITDDETLPHFTRASQNITAMMALLHGLLEATMSEVRRAHCEIRTLLERAAT